MKNITKLLHHINVVCMNQEDVNLTPVNSDEVKLIVFCSYEEDDGGRANYYAEIVNSTPEDDSEVSLHWTRGSRRGQPEQLLELGDSVEAALARLDASIGAHMVEIGI